GAGDRGGCPGPSGLLLRHARGGVPGDQPPAGTGRFRGSAPTNDVRSRHIMRRLYAALIPVSALVLLLAEPARAADPPLIAVSVAPDQVCPGARQVTDALVARLPGIVLPHGQAARPGMLRLAVVSDGAGSIRIDLADPDGAPLLHR